MFASVLLVPIMYLHGDGADSAEPEFALSGPPRATWLEADRVVADAPVAPTTSTTRRPAVSGSAGLTAAAPAAPAAPAAAVPAAPTSTAAAVPAPAPTTTAATTVAKPAVATPTVPAVTTTTPRPVSTTTAVPVPLPLAPVTPAQKPFGTHSARGVASWFNAPDGTCAHTAIPLGTVVRVTRLANGAVTTCIVDQWGPADTSRIIDLSMDTFEKLAAPEAGLIDVLIEW